MYDISLKLDYTNKTFKMTKTNLICIQKTMARTKLKCAVKIDSKTGDDG